VADTSRRRSPGQAYALRTHPDRPDHVYTAASDSYAESPDCGESWIYPTDGLDHHYVWGLAVDPGDPGTVVVSAASGARLAHSLSRAESYVYRKAGDEWAVAMDGLPEPEGTVRAVLAPGDGPGEFVALTNRGIFRSHDGAESWTELPLAWPDTDRRASGLAVV
jgi:hypothetical protein